MLDSSESFPEDSGAVIRKAFDGMTRMANHINEMKRKHEHAVRIQEIQSILHQWQGEDLTTYGELLLEVTIYKYPFVTAYLIPLNRLTSF